MPLAWKSVGLVRCSAGLALVLLTAALAGCGGGAAEPGPGASALQDRAPQKAALQASSLPSERPQALASVGAKELFDWAEFKWAGLFPKGPQNAEIQFQGFTYTIRGYSNGNFLGLRADGQVFGLGPFTADVLTSFGALADYVAQIQADRCQVYPGSCGAPRGWAGAALLEDNNDFNIRFGNSGPLSAIDLNGNALVLWEQSDGTPDGATRKVFSRRYVAGQGWGPAVNVAGLQVRSSAIAVDGRLLADAAGNMTWIDVNGGARRYSPASGWSNTLISPAGAGADSLSAAVIDANGTIHVLRRGSGNVFHTTLPAGASQWTPAVAIAGSNGAVSGGVKLAVGAAGAAVAVWRERNPGDSNDSLWANRQVGGSWQNKVRIEEMFTQVRGEPGLASDALGNTLAAWHQGSSLYVSRLDVASGSWGAPQELDARQVDGGFDARIGLVMHADGRAVIGWNSGIFAFKTATFSPAAGLSAPVLATPYSIDRTLQMDSDGRVVVAHRSDPGWPGNASGIRVQTQELPWGGAWSAPSRLDSGPGGILDDISFVMNASGLGLVAWAQNDIASSSVRNSLWVNLRR